MSLSVDPISVLIRQQASQIDKLAAKELRNLRGIFVQAQNDLNEAITKYNPTTIKQYNELIGSAIAKIDDRAPELADGLTRRSLQAGNSMAMETVGTTSGIPKSSGFWAFTPSLRTNTIKQESANGIGRITAISGELKQRLSNEAKIGIVLGEGTSDIMKRLTGAGLEGIAGRDGVFRRALWRAEAVARTTVNDLSNKGALEGYSSINEEFPGLKIRKQWATVSDNRTSPICQALDGQIRDLEQNFEGGGWSGQHPSAHPFCRSRVISVSERYKGESSLRQTRRNEPGTTGPNGNPQGNNQGNIQGNPQGRSLPLASAGANVNPFAIPEPISINLSKKIGYNQYGGTMPLESGFSALHPKAQKFVSGYLDKVDINMTFMNEGAPWEVIERLATDEAKLIKKLYPREDLAKHIGEQIDNYSHNGKGWDGLTNPDPLRRSFWVYTPEKMGVPSVDRIQKGAATIIEFKGKYREPFSVSDVFRVKKQVTPESHMMVTLHELGHKVDGHGGFYRPKLPPNNHYTRYSLKKGTQEYFVDELFAESFALWCIDPDALAKKTPAIAAWVEETVRRASKKVGI